MRLPVFHACRKEFLMYARCHLSPFFFNDTATTEIYTLSLHDALPISPAASPAPNSTDQQPAPDRRRQPGRRSEEHTSELQSPKDLVCRLLLETKKTKTNSLALTAYQTELLRISPSPGSA